MDLKDFDCTFRYFNGEGTLYASARGWFPEQYRRTSRETIKEANCGILPGLGRPACGGLQYYILVEPDDFSLHGQPKLLVKTI